MSDVHALTVLSLLSHCCGCRVATTNNGRIHCFDRTVVNKTPNLTKANSNYFLVYRHILAPKWTWAGSYYSLLHKKLALRGQARKEQVSETSQFK